MKTIFYLAYNAVATGLGIYNRTNLKNILISLGLGTFSYIVGFN